MTNDPKEIEALTQALRELMLTMQGFPRARREEAKASSEANDALKRSIELEEERARRYGDGATRIQLAMRDLREEAGDFNTSFADANSQMELATSGIAKWAEHTEHFLSRIGALVDDLAQRPGLRALQGLGNATYSMGTNAAGTISGALGRLPFGIGAMLQLGMAGAQQESAYASGGARAFAPFAQTTTDMGALRSGLGTQGAGRDMLQKLSANYLGNEGDINAVVRGIVAGGNDIEAGLQHVTQVVSGFGRTAIEQLLGLDKAMQVPAGTFAGITANLQQNTNRALGDTVSIMDKLRSVAQQSGLDFNTFSAGITQSSSALRVFGGDLESNLVVFTNMQNMLERTQGMSHTRAGLVALDVANDLANADRLSIGARAAVGSIMAQRLGVKLKPGDSAASLEAYETGFAGLQGTNGAITPEDVNRARIEGQLEYGRVHFGNMQNPYMAYKSVFGTSSMTAHLLAQNQGQGALDPQAMKMLMDRMAELQKTEIGKTPIQSLMTGEFEKVMDRIQKPLQALGGAMLQLLGGILSAIVGGFLTFGQWLSGDHTAVGRYSAEMGKTVGSIKARFKSVVTEAEASGANADALEILGLGLIGDMIQGSSSAPAKAAPKGPSPLDPTGSAGRTGAPAPYGLNDLHFQTEDGQHFAVSINITNAGRPRATRMGVAPSIG